MVARRGWLLVLLIAGISFTALGLEHTFEGASLGYTIDYPSGWIVERPGDYTVRFTGSSWIPASRAAFTIQNAASTAIGGDYSDTGTLLADLKCQLVAGSGDICLYAGKDLVVADAAGRQLVGPQIIAEYAYAGDIYREWVAIVPHSTGEIFYVLRYIALASDYDRFEPTVLDMLSTWTIGEPAGDSATQTPGMPPSGGPSEITILLEDSGHLGPYDYAAGSYDKRYYDVAVTTHGYMAIAVIDEAGESISGWIYAPDGRELIHKPGNYTEIYTAAYEVFPGSYELKVGQDTMITESDFSVYVFFSRSPFTVEDLIAAYGPDEQVMP